MSARAFDPALLAFIVCPLTRTDVRYDADAQELISDAAGLAYPIENGVPMMFVDRARVLDPYSTTFARHDGVDFVSLQGVRSERC